MKFSFKFRMFAALAAALIFTGTKAGAQSFGLDVLVDSSSEVVSNDLVYTINVTNLTGSQISGAVVSNVLPASAVFVGAQQDQGTYMNSGSLTVFSLGLFQPGQSIRMNLTVQPTAAASVTNMVTVAAPGYVSASAFAVTLVTNNTPPVADLGVAITVPTAPVIVNDFTTYGITATNLGPDGAPDVLLTNTLPSGVILRGVSPANQTYTTAGGNLFFNLGALAAGGGANLQITVQPTNAGVLNLFASVGAPGVIDSNTVNNSASNSITVTNYLPGLLVAVTNSAQIVNQQNGLIEQSILLSNIGPNSVTAVRVTVTGLSNRLFNATGTNSGNPFVVYTPPSSAPLAPNQSVNLLLQYAPRLNFPFTNSQLEAFAVPVPDLTPPTVSSVGANLKITRIIQLPDGNIIFEFPSTTGRSYTVVYSDNILFSNAMIAPPAIVAPANQTQWIDYGPPTTMSAPASANARFYRVIQNP